MDTDLLKMIRDYGDKREAFDPGSTYIPVHNSVFDGSEIANLVESVLGSDRDYKKLVTLKLTDYLGQGHIHVSNGSPSVYMTLLRSLSSDSLGSRAILPGDEVIITPNNVGMINALHSFGVIPILVDVDLNTMLPDPTSIEMAVVEGKTKAIVISAVCGSSVNGEIIRDIADDFAITFIEDVGYGFGGDIQSVPVGSHADIIIYSFHSELLGDSGVIISKSSLVHYLIGKSMWDEESPLWIGGNSSKMIYSYLSAQMDKREYYTAMRRVNWTRLYTGLMKYNKFFRFHKAQAGSNPSWSGFILTIKEPSPFSRTEIMDFLEDNKVGSKVLVGNIFQIPAYKRYIGEGEELINSDYISRNSFMVGCNPCMRSEHTDYIIRTIDKFMENYDKKPQD